MTSMVVVGHLPLNLRSFSTSQLSVVPSLPSDRQRPLKEMTRCFLPLSDTKKLKGNPPIFPSTGSQVANPKCRHRSTPMSGKRPGKEEMATAGTSMMYDIPVKKGKLPQRNKTLLPCCGQVPVRSSFSTSSRLSNSMTSSASETIARSFSMCAGSMLDLDTEFLHVVSGYSNLRILSCIGSKVQQIISVLTSPSNTSPYTILWRAQLLRGCRWRWVNGYWNV
mgnify:CR=1 FL=1